MKKIILLISFTLSLNVFAQLSGTYYIGAVSGSRPGGGDPEFATLGAAFTALNSSGVNGPCIFYFLDEDYTEATNLALACTGTSAINTITFKPYTGVTPNINFTQLADNTGPSGRIILGCNTTASYTIVTMNYVTFDGSNTIDGTTRDLSITEVNNTPAFQYGIRIVGEVNNCTIKNIKITLSETGGTSSYGILLTPYFNTTNYIPDNIIIDNCEIIATTGGACQGIGIAANGATTIYPTGIKIRNNKITARTRGVFLSTGSGDTDIYGNEFYINQTNGGTLSEGIYAYAIGTSTNVVNIYNNRFQQLKTANTATGDFGITGIFIGTFGNYNIYNNFISNFSAPTYSNPSCVIEGIRVSTPTVNGITANIFNNTVVIPNMATTPGTGTLVPKAIRLNTSGTSGTRTVKIKNNILVSQEPDFLTYAIHRENVSLGTMNSDYNDIVLATNGKTGLYGATVCSSLADWQTTTSQDANSKSAGVNFVSSTDLHIKGTSVGNYNLAGTPISGYTTDIDGDARSTTHPYMGADEITTIPLEPYKRNVDGDGSDWVGEASSTLHGIVESSGEAIYTGEAGDARTDQHGGDANGEKNNDITDFRITRDDNYLYFRVTLNDIIDINRPYIAITIDKDQSDDSPVWVGDDSPVSLSPSTNRGWERQIALHAVSNGVLDIELFADDGSVWYAPPSNYSVAGSVSNNIIEARIALVDLGLTSTSSLRMSIGTFNNNVGYNNSVDATTASYIDVVTPGYSGTANAWFRAGADNNIWSSNVQWDQGLTTLPVELTSFTSSVKNNSVLLSWKTATEKSNYGFEVERSADKVKWSKIAFVNGCGNSNSEKNYSYSDKSSISGKQYYRLKQIDTDGKYEYSKIIETNLGLPKTYELSQNYPNPFNPSTTIRFSLPENQVVKLTIFNTLGEEVAKVVDGYVEAGIHEVKFNASNLASGIYFYRLDAGKYVQTKKMMLIK
jgi:hypothetical protein